MTDLPSPTKNTKKRVCVFFNRAYVDAHFCFHEMVTHFLEEGWEVDLFTYFSLSHAVPLFGVSAYERLKVFFVSPPPRGILQFLYRALRRAPYRAIIATPQWALYCAVLAGKMLNVPVLCLSDEILGLTETNEPAARPLSPREVKWKKREMWAHRQCALTIALSKERFELVKTVNRLSQNHPSAIVPNAPAGKAVKLKSSFYRETLAISDRQTILLHSGGLGWSLIPRLIEESAVWDDRFAVILQGRLQNKPAEIISSRVHYATYVIPSQMMRYVTSSADIGLVLYDRQVPAEFRNGQTAGKLGLYLACGLPVICCNLEILKWVEKERCGVWVEDVRQIPKVADRIMADYEAYSFQAKRVFDEHYEYSAHFKRFFEKLNQLTPLNS